MKHRSVERSAYHSTTLIAVVLLLLILFVTSGFFFWLQPSDDDGNPAEYVDALDVHLARWSEQRPASFRYVLDRNCECDVGTSTPYIVIDERGSRSAEFLTPLEVRPGEVLSAPTEPLWIHDVFQEVRRAVSDATELDVTWDERFGFPARVSVRYANPDAWYEYEIRDFEVLEYPVAQ